MEILPFHDEMSLGQWAADRVLSRLDACPDLLLCVATGHSTERFCSIIADAARLNPARFARIRLIQLDEWWDLPADDAGRCDVQLQSRLVDPLGITPGRFLRFSTEMKDADASCREMAEKLAAAGPIDCCVLGMGRNGHLGFNEPAPELSPKAHMAALTDQTRTHAMVKEAPAPPTHGVTLGMADLMAARDVILIVMGPGKGKAIDRLTSGQIRTDCPATLLHLHRNAVCGICAESCA